MWSYLILMLHDRFLLVFASLVLKPNPDHPTRQSCHFNQLFFHESIRSRICCITALHHVQLLLRQNCPNSSCSTSSLLLLRSNLVTASQWCRNWSSCTFTFIASIQTHGVVSRGKSSFDGRWRFIRTAPIVFSWNERYMILWYNLFQKKIIEFHIIWNKTSKI